MKGIVKQAEPAIFAAWKAQANEEWKPGYADLQNPEKRALHQALVVEQGGVCCYCGRSISLADSHIEHFRPQEKFEGSALSYENLYASCIRETSPGMPLHCGHAKSSEFEEDAAISPQDAGCEARFIYALDGGIHPADRADARANYMAELLRLDIGFLRERRAAALTSVFDSDFVDSASVEELMKLAKAYSAPDASGALTGFGHVLSRFAERFAEQLLGRTV